MFYLCFPLFLFTRLHNVCTVPRVLAFAIILFLLCSYLRVVGTPTPTAFAICYYKYILICFICKYYFIIYTNNNNLLFKYYINHLYLIESRRKNRTYYTVSSILYLILFLLRLYLLMYQIYFLILLII